jgi:hypothetical protein
MVLSEIFCDPLEPSASIQLNNKYWPGDKFTYLSLIADAEATVKTNSIGAAARQLRTFKQFFGSDSIYGKFLQRLHRLHSSRSHFGCEVGKIELPGEVLEANRYTGSEKYAVYPLKMEPAFSRLDENTRFRYRSEYGLDILKMNRTVRFAMPGEKVADIQDYGPLSDYHNDEYKGISTICYLSDVNEEDSGAFSFLRGSELIPRSLVLLAIHQCVFFDMQLRTPEQLKAVPLEFRGSTGVGNFLDDDKVRTLSRFREVLLGPSGTYISFNGQYLLHRGGKPVSGSRTAAFLQPEGMLRLKLRGLRSHLFGLTHH